ncbi:MAG: 50S ribosomal protein L9 [Desulfobulbaceae bacterium]|nr:50S ribosomal protein L9 [Desulfobulbaceae bacterium]
MEVILKELIDTLGEEGDVVKVKGGYGRNYLLPQRKAILATKASLAVLEKEKAAIEARKAAMRTDAESIAKKIAGLTVVIEQRAGDEDKLFGSVTTADIADKLETLGVSIDKRKISLSEPIKSLGDYVVTVKVGYQVNAEIKIQVIPVGGEVAA